MIRIVLLGFFIGGLFYAWQRWRGPKLLRVPLVWMSMARRHADLSEALRLRKAIGELLLVGSASRARSVLAEIDDVIKTLVQLARTREVRGVSEAVDPVTTEALVELEALYQQIKQDSMSKTADKLDAIRARLANRTADLKSSARARSEVEDL